MFKKLFLIFLLIILSVGLTNALPVTFTGDLLINGVSGVNTNITLVSGNNSVTGLFNDTYVLNLVAVEGSQVELLVEGDSYLSILQPSMASLVNNNIYWPLQSEGNPCTVDPQCLSGVCCTSSSATNYHQCGVCVNPTTTSSGGSSGSGSGGSSGLYVPVNDPVTENVSEELVEDFSEELVVEDSFEDSVNTDLPEEELDSFVDSLEEAESGCCFIDELPVVKEWFIDNKKQLLDLGFSLLFVVLYFVLKRSEEEEEIESTEQ